MTEEIIEKNYINEDLSHCDWQQTLFESCSFEQCKLNESIFKHCRFVDCEFINCEMSLVSFEYSSFNDVNFEKCKLIGVNWTDVAWPQIQIVSPMHFYSCNLSQCNFMDLFLAEINMEGCSARESDFRGANLKHANLTDTDFSGAIFNSTDLSKANLLGAQNYAIHPFDNKIEEAVFDYPEVINLLKLLNIKIEGLDHED